MICSNCGKELTYVDNDNPFLQSESKLGEAVFYINLKEGDIVCSFQHPGVIYYQSNGDGIDYGERFAITYRDGDYRQINPSAETMYVLVGTEHYDFGPDHQPRYFVIDKDGLEVLYNNYQNNQLSFMTNIPEGISSSEYVEYNSDEPY